MEDDKKLKVVFAPGCFDNLDIDQKGLDEFTTKLTKMVDDGSFFKDSEPLTEEDWAEMPEELREQLSKALDPSYVEERKRKLN